LPKVRVLLLITIYEFADLFFVFIVIGSTFKRFIIGGHVRIAIGRPVRAELAAMLLNIITIIVVVVVVVVSTTLTVLVTIAVLAIVIFLVVIIIMRFFKFVSYL
jgi:hypothetical protein